jgi:hypothetical protein
MEQDITAPVGLRQVSQNLKTTMGDLCFRFFDLRSGIKTGKFPKQKDICEAAYQMDKDLATWSLTLAPKSGYTTESVEDAPAGLYFKGKRHVYGNAWAAQVWNNWRTLRILLNRIILCNDMPDGVPWATALSVVKDLSNEICISTPMLIGSPRE